MRVNPNFYIVRISKELQKKKRQKITISTQGYLGLKYNTPVAEGFKIKEIEKDSPAWKAGFTMGDIVVSIGSKRIRSFEEMIEALSKYAPGKVVLISYISSFAGPLSQHESIKQVTLGEKPLHLDIPDGSQDMRFNLQFGEIVMIGDKAAEIFPEALVGDSLLFHHAVEYKQRAEGDKNWNDWHLIEEDEDFEMRMVSVLSEVFGVWKLGKTIIPYPPYIFCHPSIQKANIQMKNGLWMPDSWETTMKEQEDKLDDLKNQITELNTSSIMQKMDSETTYKQKEDIKKAIDSIDLERRKITKQMHQAKLMEATIVYINPKTNEQYLSDLAPGDKVIGDMAMFYPLDVMGAHFALARPPYLDLFIKNNNGAMTKFNPHYDRIVIKADEAEKKTEGGIIIPETAQEKPRRGVVVAVGPGKKEEPMQVKPKEKVLYSKYSGTEIEMDGEEYLIMKADEVLTAFK